MNKNNKEKYFSNLPQIAFDANKPLTVPIFDFKTGSYSNENIDLEHKLFNLPLRRDIIHRVYEWRKVLFKKTTHIARTKGTVQIFLYHFF